MNKKREAGLKNGIFVKLALAFTSIMLVVILLEIVTRFTIYAGIIFIKASYRYYYVNDLNKGWDIRPNVKTRKSYIGRECIYDLWSNELGCFDKPYNGEKDYILLLGDSFSWGFAPYQDKWGTQTENLLGRRVLKCGVAGYTNKQELLKAKEIISKIKNLPELIIVGYFMSDLEREFLFPCWTDIDGFPVMTKEWVNKEKGEFIVRDNLEEKYKIWQKYGVSIYPYSLFEVIKYWLKTHSVVAALTGDFFNNVYFNLLPPPKLKMADMIPFCNYKWLESAWEKHLGTLRLFKDYASFIGAKLIIVIIPMKEQVYPFLADWGEINPEKPNMILDNFFEAEDIHYIDLLPLLKRYSDQTPRNRLYSDKDLYWQSDFHFSIKGEHLTGLLVSKFIIENNLINLSDRDNKLLIIEDKLRNIDKL